MLDGLGQGVGCPVCAGAGSDKEVAMGTDGSSARSLARPSSYPATSILNPTFAYKSSVNTNLRETFARIRAELPVTDPQRHNVYDERRREYEAQQAATRG